MIQKCGASLSCLGPVRPSSAARDLFSDNRRGYFVAGDMTGVVASMAEDKHPITSGLVACLSPYARSTSAGSGNTFWI